MKKLIIIFLFILIGLFVILTWINWKDEYSAERKLWHINRRYNISLQNTESLTDKSAEEIAESYRKFIQYFPKSTLTPKAQIILGSVYLVKKNYSQARQEFQKVFNDYPKNSEVKAEASSGIAKSYELEGNWSKAESWFKDTTRQYSETQAAFSVPLYIAQHYEQSKDQFKTSAAYQDALEFYQNLARRSPNSFLEFHALQMKVVCHMALNHWAQAVDELEEILNKYPLAAKQITLAINNIALTQLKDFDRPIKIYEKFIQEHPENPINDVLKNMIKYLKQLKEKNVAVVPPPK